MLEKNLYPLIKKWLERKKPTETWVMEVKLIKNSTRFPLSSVKEHQVAGLLGALQGFWIRLKDQPWLGKGFQTRKAFDGIWVKTDCAYVVPVFYIPRKKKMAYLIPIKGFLKLKGKSVKEADLTEFVSFEI